MPDLNPEDRLWDSLMEDLQFMAICNAIERPTEPTTQTVEDNTTDIKN